MTTLLEERCRWWLRVLPAWYRAEREDEMVATLLDSTDAEDAEISRPGGTEIRSIIALAIRTRLGGVGAPPRARAWGDGVRLFALGAVLIQAIFAAVAALVVLHGYFLDTGTEWWRGHATFGAPHTLRSLLAFGLPVVWIFLYVAVVLGFRRTARWLVLAACGALLYRVYGVVGELGEAAFGGSAIWIGVVPEVLLLGVFPVLVLAAGLHRDTPLIRRPGWLIALLIPMTVILVWDLTHPLIGLDMRIVLFLAAAATYAVVRTVAGAGTSGRQQLGYQLGLGLLAAAIIVADIGRLVFVLSFLDVTPPLTHQQIAVAIAGVVVVGAIGMVFIVVAIRGLRRLSYAGEEIA